MKSIARRLFLAVLITGASATGRASAPDLLGLPDDNVDIGIAALTFAREFYPDLDVARYSAKIDAIAEKVRRSANGVGDPDLRIRCLNSVLLIDEGFRASRDLASARGEERYFLNRVLDTRQGNCASMPILYAAVGQRLGWPIRLVHVPDHSFVRYADPALREQNIETTSNGGFSSDETYAADFRVSERGRRSGAYLRSLSRRETLGDLATINGIAFGRRGNLTEAIRNLEMATRLNPRNSAAWYNLAVSYAAMAGRQSGSAKDRYRRLAARGREKMADLGFVHANDVPQFTSAGRPPQ